MLLFLLQSCSGGRIGNFLESSFENNISNKISQNEINKKLKSDIKVQDNKLFEKKDKTTNIKFSDEKNSQRKGNSSSITITDANKIKTKNQIYNPKSYRIFVILKKVDPSFPTENFSKVLRSGNVNFEIEKIELITDSNKNK